MSNSNGYIGKIGNTGLNKVKAPFPAGKGGGKGQTKSGGDLRSGKK